MRPHSNRCGPISLALGLLALTPVAVAQESPSCPPVVASARVEHTTGAVTVVGRDFGAARPAVTLGPARLTVTGHGPTLIVAELPATMRPGTYRLTVSTGASESGIDVAVGAAAPWGSQGRKLKGSPCTEGKECATGYCVDAVCCDGRCSGTCEKCNLYGREGSCEAVPPDTDPDNECPNNASACQAGMCTGRRACKPSASGTVCVPASCNGGVLNRPDTCNAAGACVDAGTQNCSPYACSASTGACLTKCEGNADCRSGFSCVKGKCVARPSAPNVIRPPRPSSPPA